MAYDMKLIAGSLNTGTIQQKEQLLHRNAYLHLTAEQEYHKRPLCVHSTHRIMPGHSWTGQHTFDVHWMPQTAQVMEALIIETEPQMHCPAMIRGHTLQQVTHIK